MVLLVIISLVQLLVTCLVFSVVSDQAAARESERFVAAERIRGIQQRTIRAMFLAADLTGEVVDVEPPQGDLP